MSTIKFNDILASLAKDYDARSREQLFDKIEQLETDDDAINGIKLFVEKNGRDYDKMRNTFQSFAALLEEKEQKHTKNQSLSWLKYAAVLIAISAVTIYFTMFQSKTNENLSSFEYQEIGLPVLMSNANNTGFSNAMSKYKMHEYKEALVQFNILPITDTTAYFKGVCLYELGNIPAALHEFNNVSKTSVFYKRNLYFMSLCNVKLNHKEDAILSLKILTLEDNEMKTKALELLHYLEE